MDDSPVVPHDLNVVTARLDDGVADGGFDLLIATSVLVYYDRLEQALALTNVAAMLRPGGSFLTNSAVVPPPQLRALPDVSGPVALDREQADMVFWYQRRR